MRWITSVVAGLVFAGFAGGAAWAQTTWTGAAGAEGDWNNTLNWNSNPAPTNTANIGNGGIAVVESATVTNNDLQIGLTAAGSSGTLRIKTGGTFLAPGAGSRIRLGQINGATGTVQVLGGTIAAPMCILTAGGVAGGVGNVTIESGSTVTLNNLRVGLYGTGTCTVNGGTVTLNSYDSDVGSGAGGVGTFTQKGGTVTRTNTTHIGRGAGATGTYVVSNSTLVCNVERVFLGSGGTGRLEVREGADVKLINLQVGTTSASATGTLAVTGGSIAITNLYSGYANGARANVEMSGGTLTVSSSTFWLCAADGATARWTQTGGTVNSPSAMSLGAGGVDPGSARYEISGGTLNLASFMTVSTNDVGAFRLKGSAPVVSISYLRNDSSFTFLLEYVLDKSPAHLTNMIWTTTGTRARSGHLRVGFDGGVLLTRTNAFTLVRTAGLLPASPTYASVPDPGMWSEGLADGNKESRITLANGYNMGALDMQGLCATSFTARAMGHVTLANVDTNAFRQGLAVWMDLDTATFGQTAEILASNLVAAGYTNSTVTDVSPYDVLAVIPNAYVANGPGYFAWNFTDVTTGTTNATLGALKFTAWPASPAGSTIAIR